jgi:hypothetical protein
VATFKERILGLLQSGDGLTDREIADRRTQNQPTDFFQLLGLVWSTYSQYRKNIRKLLDDAPLQCSVQMVDNEFSPLMSEGRCELIKRCLLARARLLRDAIADFEKAGKSA